MTYIDPDAPVTNAEIRRAEVRDNRAAWWVAGVVAVVAIIAVAFMVTRQIGRAHV